MSEVKYSRDHEWLSLNDDGIAIVGITDYAQKELGDVVYVELPDMDKQVEKNDDVAVIESVKTASDIKSPISGVIVGINEELNDDPEKVNADPQGEGWIFKLKLTNEMEINQLMDESSYNAYVGNA